MKSEFKNILSVHNSYQQKGGEDESCRAERDLLRSKGHNVVEFNEHNSRIKKLGIVKATIKNFWSQEAYKSIRKIIVENDIEIVHVQNFFPLISPSVFYAARDEKVPVVFTLRNYRLICSNGIFFKNGNVCEKCLVSSHWMNAVGNKCYRNSVLGTAAVVGAMELHRILGTWNDKVDLFISLTDFARNKYVNGGLPKDKIMVKPNFVFPDPGIGAGQDNYFLFAGRLSEEKGIITLINAWKLLNASKLRLVIAGDGELSEVVKAACVELKGIDYVGSKTTHEIYELMGNARALIFPSEWYEGMPRTIIESFSKGTPVIASNLGAMSAMIEHGYNGFHFKPGDAESLVSCLRLSIWINGDDAIRSNARESYLNKYTADANYTMLIAAYEAAKHNLEASLGVML